MDDKTNIHQIQTLENTHYPRSNAQTTPKSQSHTRQSK